MPNINNVIQKHSSKIIKNPASSTIKTCDCRRKTEGNCPMGGNCLSESLIYKSSLNTTTYECYNGTCKTLSKNVTISINVLLEINLAERTLNCPSMYRNRKREILIIY